MKGGSAYVLTTADTRGFKALRIKDVVHVLFGAPVGQPMRALL